MRTQGRARVLVLGGGYAGMLAAARVARCGGASITLIDQREDFVQRIRLHEALAGAQVPGFRYEPALARRGVAFVQGRVVGIHVARQEVEVVGAGPPQHLGYDTLIVALGSTTTLGAPGAVEHAVHLDDPLAIGRAAVELRALAASGGRALIVGGGLTAVEAAAELASKLPGLRVTLAAGGALGESFSPAAAAYLCASLARLGVEVREDARVASVEPGRAHLVGGDTLVYDCCIWVAGFAAPRLLADTGLPVDAQGRVRVHPELHVRDNPTIYVAGDSAAAGTDREVYRMGCVTALPLGAHAGENVAAALAGEAQRPFQFGFPGRNVSLGRHNGLVQLTDRRDRPTGRIITGRAGATVKELVCRMTLESVRAELRTGLSFYHWLGAGDPWAATAATT